MRPYARCLLPWNCVVGACFFVWAVDPILLRLGVPFSTIRAIGCLCALLALRLLLTGRGHAVAETDRIARRLLIGGYTAFAATGWLGPMTNGRLADEVGLAILAAAVMSMLAGAILGNHSRCRSS